MTDHEAYVKKACEQFVVRKMAAAEIAKVENGDLPAGSPMFFYCKECGIPTEKLPEDYLLPPYQHCSQCNGLIKEGILEEAKQVYSRMKRE